MTAIKYLLDTSAIFNLIQAQGSAAEPILHESASLDLAYYELGNTVWKMRYRNLVSEKEGNQLLADTLIVFEMLQILPYDLFHMADILTLSVRHSITFYDAAFFQAAIENELIFVTDDKKLKNASSSVLTSIHSKDL